MKDIILANIFLIIVVLGYTVFVLNHYIRFKKSAGEKVMEYAHNSTVKIMGYIMMAIGVFYTVLFIIEKQKTASMITSFVLFIYFIVLVSYISTKNIVMYEHGLTYSGKFLMYQDMIEIQKVGKKGIQIKMQKKGLSEGVYINKIADEKTFVMDLKKQIKLSKKSMKKSKKISK